MHELVVILGLPALLLASLAAGRRLGRVREEDLPHLGVVQGASLGLLGLLVGFSFSGAVERFVARQDIITQEANAISTAWLRTDLLPDSQRMALRNSLRNYAERRVALFHAKSDEVEAAILAELTTIQAAAWRHAIDGVAASPPLAGVVLPPLNDVFDLLTNRNAATRKHIPVEVLTALIACAMLTVCTINFGHARRSVPLQVPTIGLVLLISAVIWVTIDLDFPRRGFVKISADPLIECLRSMQTER